MKNITLSVDDGVYRKARIAAAERGTSVSGLVRDYLEKLTHQDSRRKQGVAERNQLMEALLQQTAHFRIGAKPTREEMNER
ncbi:MAG: DUF6364 family protein [Verrucomicrobiota bacterium]